jgi:small subunit ribosomal protein S16
MAIKIRLARGGSKKRPFYKIVAADSRMPRDGRFIEKLGTYNPLLPKNNEARVTMDIDRINYWLGQGAQVTDRISRMLEASDIIGKKDRNNPKKGLAGKAAEERIKKKAQKAEEAKTETVEETKTETIEEAKTETVEETKTETVEEAKTETVEETKTETVEEAKTETTEEPKTETVEEAKTETIEEAKTETIEEAKTETIEEAKTEAADNKQKK